LQGNIMHWTSNKSRRVIKSILVLETLVIIEGYDRGYILATTIRMILKQLDLLDLLTIVYTDSYSLYEYLVKLGTTKKKRLMIDIIVLR
jgi:hypothetical protein